MARPRPQRVLIIGLDCAAPRFVFDRERLPLPNLHALMDRGPWGSLRSCDPPITIPAWSCMTTGLDAGTLGVYGFRNRRDRSYDSLALTSSRDICEKRLWDYADEAGLDSVVLGVPQTYPPQPLRGCLVSGLLTPNIHSNYTYPPELAAELRANCAEYLIDVPEFRSTNRGDLLHGLHDLMQNRFDLAEYLAREKPWSFFMMVEIGLDRLHHAFWLDADPEHPAYRAGNPHEGAIPDYYRALDERIGRLLNVAGDEVAVLVVSDHGARALQGGFAINQWLIEQGHLALFETPAKHCPLTPGLVDWDRTRAWGEGGYYARINVNVKGREPRGTVERKDYEAFRGELARALESAPGPDGAPLGNVVLKPESVYDTVKGIPPDLIVYFGGLSWRSVGQVGGGVFWRGNDTGPDGANHDFEGVFILDDRSGRGGARIDGLSLFDVAPTALGLLGIDAPSRLRGRNILA
jgi:predicted AlkP superfamily phosphohydrolase/phosphomutase